VHDDLRHGQLVKRRERRKVTYTVTRMLWGKHSDLYDRLGTHGFRRLIQTAFIERVNLTIRQGVSLLTRRTWSLSQTDHHLLNHVEWWRGYYHWNRPHQTLREPIPGGTHRHRDRTPAMALGLTDHIWTVEELLCIPVLTRLAHSDPSPPESRPWRGFGGVRASHTGHWELPTLPQRTTQRPVFDFLREVLVAYCTRQPPPSLLPAHLP
jgi:hypothetical protein